jgi:hypothetical protein
MVSIEIIERKKEWTNEAHHWKHFFLTTSSFWVVGKLGSLLPPVEAVIHFSTRFIFLFGFSVWCSVPLACLHSDNFLPIKWKRFFWGKWVEAGGGVGRQVGRLWGWWRQSYFGRWASKYPPVVVFGPTNSGFKIHVGLKFSQIIIPLQKFKKNWWKKNNWIFKNIPFVETKNSKLIN